MSAREEIWCDFCGEHLRWSGQLCRGCKALRESTIEECIAACKRHIDRYDAIGVRGAFPADFSAVDRRDACEALIGDLRAMMTEEEPPQ